MKLSGIALLFLSLTTIPLPHLCTNSSQVKPEIIKPSNSLSTAWPVQKSLKLYCYHCCVSWRQAVVHCRWDGANFHWAEDSPIQPLLAVHKQEQTPCVCLHACAHVGEKECVSACGRTQMGGGKATCFYFLLQKEVKPTKKCNIPSSLRNCKGEKGKHWQLSCKNYHSIDEIIMKIWWSKRKLGIPLKSLQRSLHS